MIKRLFLLLLLLPVMCIGAITLCITPIVWLIFGKSPFNWFIDDFAEPFLHKLTDA